MVRKLEDIIRGMVEDDYESGDTRHDASETIVIDIDEIMDNFGMPFVYRDIVDRKRGLGNVSQIYNRLVHPVIVTAINNGIESGEDYLRRLANARHDEELGNYLVDSFKKRIWEYYHSINRHLDVRTEDVLIFCITIAEIVIGRLRDFAIDYQRDIQRGGTHTEATLQIAEECSSSLVPLSNPDSLLIHVNYYWLWG